MVSGRVSVPGQGAARVAHAGDAAGDQAVEGWSQRSDRVGTADARARSGPGPARRRLTGRSLWSARFSSAAALLALAGCASSETAAPEPTPTGSTPTAGATQTVATPTGPASSPSAGGGSGWSAAGPSFGVDRAAWPRRVKDTRRVLDGLPASFAGHRKNTTLSGGGEDGGPEAVADYGDDVALTVSEEYSSTDTADGKPQLMTARQLLAANFMLGLACDQSTYQGNALPREDGSFPRAAADEPVWFSCAVDGAEGDEDYQAHAVGWTSGKTAWLALAPDSETLRSLVTATHDAAS